MPPGDFECIPSTGTLSLNLKTAFNKRSLFVGAPMEIRTPVLALKGPRANRYTMGAYLAERQDFTIPTRTGQAIT